MKKKILALAALATIAGAAQAEENGFQFYGIFDIGVAHETNTAAPSATFPTSFNVFNGYKTTTSAGSQSGIANGPISDPRLGLNAHYGLDNGWHMDGNLESGFNVTSGQLNNAAKSLIVQTANGSSNETAGANSSLDGQIFNRSAYGSIGKDDWGDLRVGRNTQFALDTFSKMDPVQNAQLFSIFGYSGTYGGGMGSSDNARADNSLKYMNKYGNINYGAMYEFGNGTGVAQDGRGTGVVVGYAANGFNVQFVQQTGRNVIKTAASSTVGDLTGTIMNTVGSLIAISYEATTELTVKGGFESYTMTAPSNLNDTLPGSMYGYATSSTSILAGNKAQTVNVTWIGGDYKLTPEMRIYAGFYNVNFGATASGLEAYTNTMTSLLLDYNLDNSKDIYVGVGHTTYGATGDGSISSNNGLYPSTTQVATGFRFKF